MVTVSNEADAAPPLLEAHDLGRRYPGGAGVALSVAVGRGQVLGVVGPNGAGKSTALALLAARLRPDRGRLRVAGVDAARRPAAARREIGYLGHRTPLYGDMRVADYLAHAARLFGIRRRACGEAVERALARAAIGEVAARRISNLSQGYRQRVGLAQALVHDPAVLVLDEPTAGLDAGAAAGFVERLAPLAEGRAVVLASHLFGEIDRVCDRVMVIHGGRGTPAFALSGGGGDGLVLRVLDADRVPVSAAALGIAGARPLPGGRLQLDAAGAALRGRLLDTVRRNDWALSEWLPTEAGLTERIYRATIGEARAC